ncbi:ATP-binding cassette domain-containing protein [Glaciecola siphonariae]|uniref:ATP-binding cassette domain-containing protein n=1 Tax=Glaciecola siphonariae TaxID=521012 RepID=A0ABV9LYC5_9ALTE
MNDNNTAYDASSALIFNISTPSLNLRAAPKISSKHRDLSLNLDLHAVVGILGDSGAGKTSLLKRMAGLSKAETQLRLSGISLDGLSTQQNPCVYLGSDAPLFEHLSLQANLDLVFAQSIWRAKTSAKLRQKYGFDDCEPITMDEVVKLCEVEHLLRSPCHILSGGEKQRGLLARALLSAKPILLLDEAFSAMDWALRHRIYKQLRQICQTGQRAIVMVSHSHRELALMSDTLVQIQDGEIVEHGSTSAALAQMQNGSVNGFSALELSFIAQDTRNHLSKFCLKGTNTPVYARFTEDAHITHRLLLEAQSIVIARQGDLRSSMLNCLPVTLRNIEQVDNRAVLTVDAQGQSIIAQISLKSLSDMQLAPQQALYAYFKAL